MSTKKLYLTDSYLQEFTAQVIDTIPWASGRWGVILNRSAFYPEGGGQPSDAGTLDNIPVIAVAEKDGDVIHITATKPSSSTVFGRLDWTRRFDHMQQHSGEHVLSAAFSDLFGAENIGFHLGAEAVSIDLNINTLSPEQAVAAEKLANSFVFANRPVQIHQLSGSDLAGFTLRKQPVRIFSQIRLVAINGVDCCPCGGTHVAATGEIGLIKIRTWEHKAGATRVEFVCGYRALADYATSSSAIRQLSGQLSVPPADVPAAVGNQLTKLDMLTKSFAAARQELWRYMAADLYAKAECHGGFRIIAKTLAITPSELGDLAKHLLALGPAIILLGSADAAANKSHLLFACSPGAPINMNTRLKAVLPLIEGKGGGQPHWAQGGGGYTASLENLLFMAANQLRN